MLLIQAGSDAKVQQMLNNFILSSPADLETTARIFKRDSDVMLRILRDLGVEPEDHRRLIEVWNKADLLTEERRAGLLQASMAKAAEARPALVSAITGEGLDDLMASIERRVASGRTVLEVVVPADKVGQQVAAGPPLFRVDDRQLKAQLAWQTASLKAAEAQLARLNAMPRTENLPPAEARVAAQ